MKNSYKIYSMIAMASIMACNKVETSEQIEQQDGHNIIYATSEATKTTITDTGIRQVEWLEGDEVMVYNTSCEGKKYTAQNGGTTAKFVSADGLTGDYCAAVYPASLAKGCANGPIITAEVPSQQDGDFRNLVFAGVPKACGSNQFLFTAVTSIIKINVPAEKDIVKIDVISDNDNICGQFTATYSNYKWTTANGDNLDNKITVTAGQGHTLPETVYIAVLPTSSNPKITINGYKSTDSDSPFYNKTATLATTLKANVIENFGTIQKLKYDPKAFTIDAEGHQVFFAPGNLQYQASTNTWRFAEHQFDFVGGISTSKNYGTVYIGKTKCYNEAMSETYDGWIDSFGFGTSGYDAKPYENSASKYPIVDLTLKENYIYDWGRYCDIRYKENDEWKDDPYQHQWHTMTRAQWNYLFSRKDNTDNVMFGKIQLTYELPEPKPTNPSREITGLIILPDGFIYPTGIEYTFKPGNNDNKFSMEVFGAFIQNGAAFMPFCSRRGVGADYGKNGFYHTTNKGKQFAIGSNGYMIEPTVSISEGAGCSVRLVRDVPAE